jgi:hypothetical protein
MTTNPDPIVRRMADIMDKIMETDTYTQEGNSSYATELTNAIKDYPSLIAFVAAAAFCTAQFAAKRVP